MPQNINHIVHSQNEHNKDSRNLLKDIKELLTPETMQPRILTFHIMAVHFKTAVTPT